MHNQEFKIDIGVGIASIIIGVAAFVLSLPFPGRAALFPKVVSFLFCVLGSALALSSWRRMHLGAESCKAVLSWSLFKSPLAVLGLLILYVVVMQTVGFYVTTPIMLVLYMRWMGVRRVKTILIATVSMMLFVFLLFTFSLGIPLPQGLLR